MSLFTTRNLSNRERREAAFGTFFLLAMALCFAGLLALDASIGKAVPWAAWAFYSIAPALLGLFLHKGLDALKAWEMRKIRDARSRRIDALRDERATASQARAREHLVSTLGVPFRPAARGSRRY